MQDRNSAEYQQWRQDVRQRDGNACRRCGFSTNLEVHHIKPFVRYPEFVTELHNGLTLCGNCHSLLRAREETTDLLEFIGESPYSRDEQIVERLIAMMVKQLKALNEIFTDPERHKAELLTEDDGFIDPKHIQAEILRLEAEERLKKAERLKREADDAVKKRQREAEQKRRREAEEKRQLEMEEKQQRKVAEKLKTTKQQTSHRDFQMGKNGHLSDNRANSQVKKRKNLGKSNNSHRKPLKQINKAGTNRRSNRRGIWHFGREVGRNRLKARATQRRRTDATTPKRHAPTLRELKLHAEKGAAAAQYSLGWRYEYGEGVVKDKQETAKWYRKAAKRGYPAAQKKLSKSH